MTVSFVPDVAQCTAAARVFPELGRWRWARFAQGAVALAVIGAALLVFGPGAWLAGPVMLAGSTLWSLLTVFGPWYAPRRLQGTFWIGELVTCQVGAQTLSWWSQPGRREVPWHQVEAVGTRDGILALRTGPPYALIWMPLNLLTAAAVESIVRRAAALGADTRGVRLAGEHLAQEPVPVGAATGLGSGRTAGRTSHPDGANRAAGGSHPGRVLDADASRLLDRPGAATATGGDPIEIVSTLTAAQAAAVLRPSDRVGRLLTLAVAAGSVVLALGALFGPDLTLTARLIGLALVVAGVPALVELSRAVRRLAAGRYLRRLGDRPVHWVADDDGLTTVTAAGTSFAPWSAVCDARLDEGLLVIGFHGRRRRAGVPVAGCSVTEVDRLLCWLGTAGVWILAF